MIVDTQRRPVVIGAPSQVNVIRDGVKVGVVVEHQGTALMVLLEPHEAIALLAGLTNAMLDGVKEEQAKVRPAVLMPASH